MSQSPPHRQGIRPLPDILQKRWNDELRLNKDPSSEDSKILDELKEPFYRAKQLQEQDQSDQALHAYARLLQSLLHEKEGKDPLLDIRIRHTIMHVLLLLYNQYPEAAQQYSNRWHGHAVFIAEALQSKDLPEDLNMLHTMSAFATYMRTTWYRGHVEALYLRVLPQLENILGHDHQDSKNTRESLARFYVVDQNSHSGLYQDTVLADQEKVINEVLSEMEERWGKIRL